MTPVQVKNVTLGEGAPKVIVPLTARTADTLRDQLATVAPHADIVEWRVDFYNGTDAVGQARALADALGDVPLLATVRTSHEGGEATLTDEAYADLIVALADSGAVDLVDVEYRRDPAAVARIITAAHARGVAVVASNHDFDATPARDEIVARLRAMQDMGADICKIAVMPRSPADVLTLLDATRIMCEEHADRPVVTMSMGGLGVVSRLAGHVFGSAATFGMVGTASAPGQVDASDLRSVLALIGSAS